MSRYHYWGFILNQAGEPIENAEITVKLAGTEELACLYFDEFGNSNSCTSPELSAGPQLTSLSNGYYEFWIGDSSETYGYRNEQKFKIEWIRIGVAYGMVDYVNVFPLGPQTEPVNIADCVSPSVTKNKLISDYLACKWDSHVDSSVTDGGASIHGLMPIDLSSTDETPNRIVSNYNGWQWDKHRESTVQSYDVDAGTPHDIEEINPDDGSSTKRNKLVSNSDIYNIKTDIQNLRSDVEDADNILQDGIDDINSDTETSKAGWYTIYDTMWVHDVDDIWYYTISHNLDINWPFVICWENDTQRVIQPTDIIHEDENNITIKIENIDPTEDPTMVMQVRIANGGIQRGS